MMNFENLQFEKDESEKKSDERAPNTMEEKYSRVLSCVEQNRRQKLEVLDKLQAKVLTINELKQENKKLMDELEFLRGPQLVLAEVKKQISNIEALAKEGKGFKSKFLFSESNLSRQKIFYEEQLRQRDMEIEKLEALTQELQMKMTKACQGQEKPTKDTGLFSKTPEDSIFKLMEEKDELQEKYRILAATYAAEDRNMQAFCSRQLKKFESELKISKDKNSSIQAQLLDAQKREASLLQRLQALEQLGRERCNDNVKLKVSVMNLEQRLKQTEELNAELVKKSEWTEKEAQEKINVLERQRVELETEMNREIEKLAAEKDSLEEEHGEELVKQKAEVEKLQQECRGKTQSLLELKEVSEEMLILAAESRNEVARHQEEGVELKKEADLLRGELDYCKTAYDKMSMAQGKLQHEISALRNSEASYKTTLAELTGAVSQKMECFKTGCDKVSKKQENMDKKSHAILQELSGARSMLAEKQKELEKKNKENAELCEKISDLEEKSTILEEKIKILAVSETENLQRFAALEVLVSEQSEKLAAKDGELRKIGEAHEQEMGLATAKLEQENWNLNKKCSALEEDLKRLRVEEEDMLSNLSDLDRDHSGLKQNIHQLINLVKEKSGAHEGQCGDVSSSDAEKHDCVAKEFSVVLEKLIEEMESKMKEKDELLSQLNSQINELQEKITLLDEESRLQTALNKTLERNCSEEKAEREKLTEILEILEIEKTKLAHNLEFIQKEKDDLLEVLEENNSKIMYLESEKSRNFDVYEETEHSLEASLAKKSEKLKQQQVQIETLRAENEMLKSGLIKAQMEETEVRRIKHDNQRLRSAVTSLKSKDKHRNEVQNKLNSIVHEHNLSGQQDDCFDGPLHVLECLIDKFEGKADHLEFLKLCKPLRKKILKQRDQAALGYKVFSLLSDVQTRK